MAEELRREKERQEEGEENKVSYIDHIGENIETFVTEQTICFIFVSRNFLCPLIIQSYTLFSSNLLCSRELPTSSRGYFKTNGQNGQLNMAL